MNVPLNQGSDLSPALDRRFSVAPMMGWTDRHARYLLRLISRKTLLYTEMVTTGALVHGDRARYLQHDACEYPVAFQLGGSDPNEMSECARMVADAGYDEVNINVGCPSSRVRAGRFGACLMKEPERVAECVAAMQAVVTIPVTVKCRIGVDDQDSPEDTFRFVDTVASAGCRVFIVHARKAWLNGISPRQNRTLPPLIYDRVYELKRAFAGLEMVINGGIKTLPEVHEQLQHVDGVMVGRAVAANPYLLAGVDRDLFGTENPAISRASVIDGYQAYMRSELGKGVYLKHLTRPLVGLFLGCPGARLWRRHMTETASDPRAGMEVIERALTEVNRVAEKTKYHREKSIAA